MEDIKFKKDLKKFINTELTDNLHVLLDPKKKNSFSSSRVHTWKDLVSERIIKYIKFYFKKE